MIPFTLPDGTIAHVSQEDINLILNVSPAWRLSEHGYVRQTYPHRYLHRVIMGRVLGRKLERTERIDHKNGIRTDNTRGNLHLATAKQNLHNQHNPKLGETGYRGVRYLKTSGHYHAYAATDGKQVGIGVFATAEEAAYAYNVYVTEHRGGYAGKLNDVQPVALNPIRRKTGKTPGVRKQRNRWMARAKIKGTEYHVGSYGSEEEAVAARAKFIADNR